MTSYHYPEIIRDFIPKHVSINKLIEKVYEKRVKEVKYKKWLEYKQRVEQKKSVENGKWCTLKRGIYTTNIPKLQLKP